MKHCKVTVFAGYCRVFVSLVFIGSFVLSVFSTPVFAETSQEKIYKYQQRLIDNPRDVDAHLQLALEYSITNNFVKAVETYFALLRIDPNNFHAYNNLGILYRKGGQFRDSLHCYEQAARINPDSYWVPYNMGLCYESMGRMQEARESYGRALSLNPSFSQALQRLKSLSDPESAMPKLPSLNESQIYLVDSETGQPRIVSAAQKEQAAPAVKPAPAPVVKQSEAAIKEEKISEKIAARMKKQKEQKEQKKKYRTTRKGSSAAIFNMAMDALDQSNMEKAIELYTTCILTERDFLAEPENGLIKRGLEFLKDRPNRMPNGQFFRGLFVYISGHLALSVPDMTAYLETSKTRTDANQMYIDEANRIIERNRAELAAKAAEKEAAAAAKAALEEEVAARLAAAGGIASITSETEETERASDFLVKRMSVEQIVDEADRLARESRLQDAAAVLETGLRGNSDDLRLLMKSANVYTDMMLLKGDQEAGKMALSRFEKIRRLAPVNSRDWAIAGEMINELKGRVR